MNPLIPQPDFIPVSWGWLQFLLLLTFPFHLLAMNAMLGGLAVAVVEHLRGGDVRRQLALAKLLPQRLTLEITESATMTDTDTSLSTLRSDTRCPIRANSLSCSMLPK